MTKFEVGQIIHIRSETLSGVTYIPGFYMIISINYYKTTLDKPCDTFGYHHLGQHEIEHLGIKAI